jgi:iron complex outermembrane receptor protein
LLKNISDISLIKIGDISNLPVVNGFSDDRIRISVDGMALSSACPNHMNLALSYIAPSNVGLATVVAGLTAARKGGVSITAPTH